MDTQEIEKFDDDLKTAIITAGGKSWIDGTGEIVALGKRIIKHGWYDDILREQIDRDTPPPPRPRQEIPALPYSEVAEKGLVCSMWNDPEVRLELKRLQATAAMFHLPIYATLFSALAEITDGHLDSALVFEHLRRKGVLKEFGLTTDEQKQTLESIFNFTFPCNWKFYFERVVACDQLRAGIKLSWRLQEKATDPRANPEEMLELVEEYRAKVTSQQEQIKLSGRTLLDFLDLEIDPMSNLLGNRWLSRDGSAFVISPSGHGKSSLEVHLAICWSIGRVAFGIKPSRPQRILIVES